MAERAPLLIARDVEAAVSTREGARATREGAGEGVGATDEDDGWLARARGAMMDATTRRGSVGRLSSALALVGALAALACVAGLGGDRGVAARAGLGSHHGHKKEILEGSTKNCVNAAADNAAGTFQMETSKCEDLSTPGCVGHRSMCRFCQTHMATNRNHDWPVCPATVCAENDVHGCKSESGKKMTKRELAWDILRQHVLDHNSMVAGIKIGKCHGNSQDHGLGRYQYSDSQCLRTGLPGCLGAGAACRFCNVKNAKKAGNEWPTCPMAVCDKYDVKSKYCAKLTQYHVPPETPPKDWDEKSLPDTMSVELDEDDEDADSLKLKSVKSHHQHKHKHSEDDDDDDDDDIDAKPVSKHSKHSDSAGLGEDEGEDDDEYYSKESTIPVEADDDDDDDDDDDEEDEEDYEDDEDEDEDEDKSHVKKHHHHHSKVKLGNQAALDDQAIVHTHKNEQSVKQTHAASDLDSLVFEEIDVEAISSERGKKRSSRGTE